MSDVSIVIPAYNEEKNIGPCLAALVAQKTSYSFEVIVVDNNSTDTTAQIAQSFADKLTLRVTSEKTKGRGAARRAGFAAAQGAYILSTDADTQVPSHWVESIVSALRNNVVVTGPCFISDCAPSTNRVFNFIQPWGMHLYRLAFGHYWLSGFNFGIKKDIYEKSGGFDTEVGALEDIDLSFKVARIAKIKYLGNCKVNYSGRRFESGIIPGFLPYFTSLFSYFLGKKRELVLSDIRR